MMQRGIRLLEEKTGHGSVAKPGDDLIYNLRVYLNRGEEIPVNDSREPFHKKFRRCHKENVTVEAGYEFINFKIRLGRSDIIRGLEYSLHGMREGGYRKVKISPHLAYKIKGLPGKIPPNAAITFRIWLRKIIRPNKNFKPAA